MLGVGLGLLDLPTKAAVGLIAAFRTADDQIVQLLGDPSGDLAANTLDLGLAASAWAE